MRADVAYVISSTYESISEPVLAALVGSPAAADFDALLAAHRWQRADGGLVFVAALGDVIKSKAVVATTRFDSEY